MIVTIPDLSICVVTLQARDYLKDCLRSIELSGFQGEIEIIVVDQNSVDGTAELLRKQFPKVQLIQTQTNEGFTKPMNLAMKVAKGRFVAQLNPDTVIHPGAFDHLCAFLKTHSKVGIVGPKVLNPDGTLQEPCRRGDARPWAVISYFSGLSKCYPDKAFFNGYLLSHLDEDQTNPVDGVSGSCMLIRRGVIDDIGYLDELFFAYQEDADYCLRARQAGWEIYYHPEAKITHFGGQGGSRVQPYRSIVSWHKSYFLYYRKHFAADYFFIFNWFYYILMSIKLVITLIKNQLSRSTFAGERKPG
jgi:GT2 family glycosyltransferase